VLIGVGLAISVFIFSSGVLYFLTVAIGSDYRLRDVGDVFVKADTVAKYADERLAAAATNQPLPEPPQILADLTTVKLGFGTTLVYEAALVAIVGGTTQQTLRGLVHALGLDSYSASRLWRPAVAAVAGYTLVILYSLAANASGIDLLKPQSTIPNEIVRDNLTLVIAGVLACVAAPISEEIFFRGFVFTGLLKWGVLPAAALSALAFSLAHFDPGSVIPFFGIGLLMAWLYWSRGSLWDSIAFHFLFNSVSFLALILATKG
jgi:uncharacterized protein